jgi:preprotein translocase subunit SecE
MGETEKLDKAPKTSWFTGLSAEFKKIIWPDKKSLVRQTTAVVAVSVVLGLVIALLDSVIQYAVNFLVGLSF